jgi:hypothetical protein
MTGIWLSIMMRSKFALSSFANACCPFAASSVSHPAASRTAKIRWDFNLMIFACEQHARCFRRRHRV